MHSNLFVHIYVCLHMMVSNIYCFVFLRVVCPVSRVFLIVLFSLPLQYSLTFIVNNQAHVHCHNLCIQFNTIYTIKQTLFLKVFIFIIGQDFSYCHHENNNKSGTLSGTWSWSKYLISETNHLMSITCSCLKLFDLMSQSVSALTP
jgi:hypothetical protein